MIRTKSQMLASQLIKTGNELYFYYKVPMNSLVFVPSRLFADRDDSADILFEGQFDYRLGAPAHTGAGSVIKRFTLLVGVKRLFTDPQCLN